MHKTVLSFLAVNIFKNDKYKRTNKQFAPLNRGPITADTNFYFPSFHQMVITESRRVDTAWIVNGELTDRSALSDELADFCAQYPIYHVKKAQESLEVTGIQTQGEVIELTAPSSFNSN